MTKEQVYEIFDQDGLLCNGLDSFEFREGQLNMALDVLECYEGNLIGAIEAGTGIGKSFAYLVPALFYAAEAIKAGNKDRTVVATSTINLQRQLLEKDIPTLFTVLGFDCPVAIAVGRGNYICLRRLAGEVEGNALFKDDGVSDISRLHRFANETETGLRSDFNGRLDPLIWSSVCSDSDLCMGGKCPFFSRCFFFKAKKKLGDASIIICNHHLLFVDSHSRYEEDIDYSDDAVLPAFRHLVVDEAHNMERHATDLFTSTFSSYSLMRQISYIYDRKASKGAGYGRMLDDLLQFSINRSLYEDILSLYDNLRMQADTLNLMTIGILDLNKMAHLLFTTANAQKVLGQIGEVARNVVSKGQEFVSKLSDFAGSIKSNDEIVRTKCDDMVVHISRIADMIELLRSFIECRDWSKGIYYLDIEKHAKVRYVTFNNAPLEVSDILAKALFGKLDSVVCTSATLDLNDGFGYWNSGVGLPLEGKGYLRKVYSSPFDYRNRLMLLTPSDPPVFTKETEQQYADYICETVYQAVASSGGGALVLFTSFKLMEYAYASLAPRFAALGISSFKQGDGDRYSLLEQFKTDTDSTLFATDSFWEGVDAPGDTLRLVIITKLPFRMPDDPIYRARIDKMEADGKSGFFGLLLPDATMRLKQGYGRLMRHTSDRGIVLILDSRIVTKGYGQLMLHSLPESYHPATETSTIGEKIESFLY